MVAGMAMAVRVAVLPGAGRRGGPEEARAVAGEVAHVVLKAVQRADLIVLSS